MVTISNTVQLITPDQAAFWLKSQYKHQRQEDKAHTAQLARAMIDGTFSPVNTIMFTRLKGETNMINGQHTLRAIIMSGKEQMLPVAFYDVDNEHQQAQLYFRIDRQRQRNFGDSIRATGLCEETGLTPTQAKQIATAAKFIKTGFGITQISKAAISDDDLIQWVPIWQDCCKAILDAISPCTGQDRSIVTQQPVFAVALVTMRYQGKLSREFWRQVVQDDGLEKHDPRKTLRRWIQERRNSRHLSTQSQTRASEIARAAILAWNAFHEGRMLHHIRVNDKYSIVKIAGTPYKGAQDADFLPRTPLPIAA